MIVITYIRFSGKDLGDINTDEKWLTSHIKNSRLSIQVVAKFLDIDQENI